MFKILRLTVALPLLLLPLITGCSNPDSPKATSVSNPHSDKTAELNTPKTNKTTVKQVVALSLDNPDPDITAEVKRYLNDLEAQGFAKENQGVWIQTNDRLLVNHQGIIPLPAASVTKAATTLAVLQKYGPDYQFVTKIGAIGSIEKGVLKGDLVIEGGEDPFFVWEEAIALGNTLNKIGIQRVAGNLVITGKFYMNYESSPQKSGELLREGLNSKIWLAEAETQFQTLPAGTPRPEVIIEGSVKVLPAAPTNVKPLVRHLSFPLFTLLKKMNMYSNNMMAEILADSVGGAEVVARLSAEAAGVPAEEIQLINGSGLGEENKISPRAAVGIFQALEKYLRNYNMTLADVFAIAGKDLGVLQERKLPTFFVTKTGTLNNVSSLAGVLPTQKLGSVWVAIMNVGYNQEGFRAKQEELLNRLLKKWGTVANPPAELLPTRDEKSKISSNEIL
ncbi:MAG: D-alanyl-D-alanine carboxypeptidase [Oscillatoriaceae bacterium SKW80]|nr:D-alanyl-D-alanine carboxypeptidase [Oscillatoriaceae bacterium SKW80]HIK27915.1 D-alanyl-D-alanine carboxypeptidase [Oscillatoriaceae cyanobacterium M7585_C2015_266]